MSEDAGVYEGFVYFEEGDEEVVEFLIKVKASIRNLNGIYAEMILPPHHVPFFRH